jgi:hypothetical protein
LDTSVHSDTISIVVKILVVPTEEHYENVNMTLLGFAQDKHVNVSMTLMEANGW